MTRVLSTLRENVFTFVSISLNSSWNEVFFQTQFVEKIKTHILCSVTFIRKSCRLRGNVENCGGAREIEHISMAHARCILDK
jgi:hypothetical protein